MPSQWKFEVHNEDEIVKAIATNNAIKKSSLKIKDIYFRSHNSKETVKIRILEDNAARVIRFKRDSSGIVSDFSRVNFTNYDDALKSLEKDLNKLKTLEKEIFTYDLLKVEIILHKFTNKRLFVSFDGKEDNILDIINLFNIDPKNNLNLSFDDII